MAGMFGRLPPYPMNGLNYPSPNFDYFGADAHGQMFGKSFLFNKSQPIITIITSL